MELKWDSYYKREIPYRMTLDELHYEATKRDSEWPHYSEENVLAYIRHRGPENVRFYMSVTHPRDVMNLSNLFGIPMILSSRNREYKTTCKVVTEGVDDIYNPMYEKDNLHEGHWYHAYKIVLTPTDYEGVLEKMYVSDFVSGINRGYIEIWE